MSQMYCDVKGVFHVVESADQNNVMPNTKVITVSIPNAMGYPIDKYGKQICIYEDKRTFIDGNQHNGKQVNLSDYPLLETLVNDILG